METLHKRLKTAILKKECLREEPERGTVYHMAYSGTSNYLGHTGIAMTSVAESNPYLQFHFHLFINGIELDDKEKMKRLAEQTRSAVTLYYVNDAVFQDMLHRDGIAGFFYRFVIPPALAEEKVRRVLYTDGDVMCQGELESLLNMDLEGNIAACVEDTSPAFAEMRRQKIGTKQYFNSGVILMDVDRWNEADISARAAAMAVERKRSGRPLASHDQDILNLLLDGRFKMVNRRYNAIYNMDMKGFFQKQGPLVYDPEAVLIHFAGIVKPWRTWVQDLPAVKRYNAFRLDSPWSDVPLVGPQRHKDVHQAARHARRMHKYGKSLGLYLKYFGEKLTGRK